MPGTKSMAAAAQAWRGFFEPGGGVVVGERQGRHATPRARFHQRAGASTPSEKWLCVWKSTSVSLPASIQGSV
jgi:hypothetical protein